MSAHCTPSYRLCLRARLALVLILLAVIGALCPGGWYVCLSQHGIQLVDAGHVATHRQVDVADCCDQADAEGDVDGDVGGKCSDLDPAPVVSQVFFTGHPELPAGVLLGELPTLLIASEPLRAGWSAVHAPGPPPPCVRCVVLLI